MTLRMQRASYSRTNAIAGALCAVALLLAISFDSAAQESKLRVLAAENFYGDIARQIGGDLVAVESALKNPNQDPHLFETTPSVVRQLAGAQIIILNGAGYDSWMDKLVSAVPRPNRIVLNVAELLGKKSGDNPHFWVVPGTMQIAGRALAGAFSRIDPAHEAAYASRLKTFEASLEVVKRKIDEIRARYAGAAVSATEPIFGYMVSALGLQMRNEHFQLAVMNDTEPSARDIAAFEADLKDRKVKVLVFNTQANTNLARRMTELARRSGIPVVGVTETEPEGVNYQDWMLSELERVREALAISSK